MKKIVSVLTIFLLAFLINLPCGYSDMTFNVTLNNLPVPSGIEGLRISLNVLDDFEFIKLETGPDIPAPPQDDFLFPWDFFKNPPGIENGSLVIDLFNSDVLDTKAMIIGGVQYSDGVYNERNLVDGVIAILTYNGTIQGVGDILAGDSTGNPVPYNDLLKVTSFSPEGVTISAVPIPATAILFLSGIFGLVGIRKFKAGKRES